MVSRLTWLVYLVTVAVGSIAVFYSVVFMRADFFAGALAMVGVAWLAHGGLRNRLPGLEAELDAFDEDVDGVAEKEVGCSERVGGITALLKEWDGLESRRGTAKFDPWALQSVRGEIREAVRSDPELARLFCPRE